MSRKIEFSRLHAINWYGYRDTFDIHGNLLIAGVTGSGKSILMDLIQLVLIGDRRSRYNQSATGAASTRSLKGYCLGDTKQEIDGKTHYMREHQSITYVAMEFTWPGGKEVETWGLRIEFESAAREEPNRRHGFMIPRRLDRSDFLDANRVPLEFEAFRSLVQKEKGRLHERMEDYRREMAQPAHLNFDRATVDYLLPAAMSFTFLKSFNAFCREYILPAGEIDVKHVRESYQAFMNLRRSLEQVRDQQARLERIEAAHLRLLGAVRDEEVARVLEADFREKALTAKHADLAREIARLEKDLEGETKKRQVVEDEMSTLRLERDTLRNILAETPDGRLFFHLKTETDQLSARVSRLRDSARQANEALQARTNALRHWLEMLAAIAGSKEKSVKALVKRLEKPVGKTKGPSSPSVDELREIYQSARVILQEIATPAMEQEKSLRRELERLQESLASLQKGTITQNAPLLRSVQQALGGRAQALRELCEVSDERWRPALEVVFRRKFAVVVEERDYEKAEKLYHSLKIESPAESLVHPRHALEKPRPALPGSLATKLQTDHPVARAIIDSLLGDIICVNDRAELQKHDRAVLDDGFLWQKPFAQRPRHYDNRPCIGAKGMQSQQSALEEEAAQTSRKLAALDPLFRKLEEAEKAARESRLDDPGAGLAWRDQDLLAVAERDLSDKITQLAGIRDQGIEEKEDRLKELDSRIAKLQNDRDKILSSQKIGRLQELKASASRIEKEAAERAGRHQVLAAEIDISRHQERLASLRDSLAHDFPVPEIAADKARDLWQKAREDSVRARQERNAERRALAVAHVVFQPFDPEEDANDSYGSRLARIREGDIPEYEEKAAREEANWQQLFRTQVLEKLRAKLLEVEHLVALLNDQLRTPIGSSSYHIVAKKNPEHEYQIYRRLLDSAELAKDDGLFFTSADEEVRETVDRLFRQLVEQPDSREAAAFLDYRSYHEYDLLVTNVNDPGARPTSVDKQSGKFSGGENQSPYFIAILACYLRAYHRHIRRNKRPSLALVPIDEAFSKLSGERIRDCIGALHSLELQGVFSMSSGNIPYAIDMCDEILAISKKEETKGRHTVIRNIAVQLTRKDAMERFGDLG